MRRDLAARAWRLPVMWISGDDASRLTATAEPVQRVEVVHVHYHVPLPPGSEQIKAPAPRAAITATEGER